MAGINHMKRNKENSRQSRTRKRSKYAEKIAAGNQMYGNGRKYHGGCCAHGIKSTIQDMRRR